MRLRLELIPACFNLVDKTFGKMRSGRIILSHFLISPS
jgi:hypothetical protein